MFRIKTRRSMLKLKLKLMSPSARDPSARLVENFRPAVRLSSRLRSDNNTPPPRQQYAFEINCPRPPLQWALIRSRAAPSVPCARHLPSVLPLHLAMLEVLDVPRVLARP